MQDKEPINTASDKMEEKLVENEATNESNPSTEQATEEAPVLSELDALKLELVDQKDKYLRLMADFENFRRRTAKERIELIQTASKEVIVSFLDVFFLLVFLSFVSFFPFYFFLSFFLCFFLSF